MEYCHLTAITILLKLVMYEEHLVTTCMKY